MFPVNVIPEIPPISSISPTLPLQRQAPHFSLPAHPIGHDSITIKPEIAHPDSFTKQPSSVFAIVAQFLERIHSIETIYLNMIERELDETHASISTNLEKHIHHQKEVEKEIASSDSWDFLRKVAIYFLGASSIVVGASLLVPGASIPAIVAAGAMILSGGASIVGNVLHDMHAHPQVATALMMVGGAFGVIGGISSAVLGIGSLTEILGRIVVAALSVATNSAEILKEGHKWKLADLKASYTTVNEANDICKERYRSMENDFHMFGEVLSQSTEACISAQHQHQSASKKIIALSGPLTSV